MPRIRLAVASLGLALVASTVGVATTAAPANAGVVGCVDSALVLVRDLQVAASGATGNDLANLNQLIGQLLADVAALDVTAIQAQAEFVLQEAAANVIDIPPSAVADAENVLTSCRVS
jgi:hypothetical protein